jgi:hypothetical protein
VANITDKGWDALIPGPPHGGLAVAVGPAKERIERVQKDCHDLLPDETKSRPPGWSPEWREALLGQAANLIAGLELKSAWVPALAVPRFVHGQSQGICDLFGARVEEQPDKNYFVYPLQPDPGSIDALNPRAPEASMYFGAVKWLQYARASCRGRFGFRNPVMTGPFDTANYLLGTTVLLEWVYTQPEVLHRLLDKITAVLISMISALREAAGGTLHGDALRCVRNAFCLCSECRSLVSAETYEEFEAPYLKRIGEKLGPYGIHSCGKWERTIPSALQDPRLRAMNGQVRENDLAELCRLAKGEIILSIAPSKNLPEKYTWPDSRSFLRHVLETVPENQPAEIGIDESDLEVWNDLVTVTRRLS